MNITDYIPHGMIAAFAATVTYVFRDHVKQDETRFSDVKTDLETIQSQLRDQNTKMSDNHAEILKVLLTAANDRANFASMLERHDDQKS